MRTYCFGESGGEGEGVNIFEEVFNMLGEEDMVNMLDEVAKVLAEADLLPGSAMLKAHFHAICNISRK